MIANNSMAEGKQTLVRVAIYTRKSNDENLTGEVTSLDNQKNACRSYIQIQKEKGWQEYPEVFDDPAESGKSLKRPAIQRLLKAVEEDRVQAIIVYKLDRLTRNSKDFHSLLELFEKHNVAFVSATESIDTKSPQGRLMTAIMVQFAQYDRELDVERSKDMHLSRAKKGLWSGGVAILGYDFKEKHLVVNETEAQLVRRIFGLYLERGSTLKVAEELNSQGFRRKIYKTQDGRVSGGKPFDLDTLTRILRRKVYIGIITNHRTKTEFPGQHKPIISKQIFDQAQQLLYSHDKRREGQITYARNAHGYLLKGLVRCGECGSSASSYSRPKKGKVYRYYKCLGKQNGLSIKCDFNSIGADKLEEWVIEKLAGIGYDRQLLERVVAKVESLTTEGVRHLEKERRILEENFKTISREMHNLIGLAKANGVNQQAEREMARLEAAKRDVEAKLGELDAKIGFRKRAVYDVDVMQGVLQRFTRFIYKIPLERRIQALHLLIRQVVVWDGKCEVKLHELPVDDLQRALDGKGGSGSEKFKSHSGLRRWGQLPTKKPATLNSGDRTPVAELPDNWRGRRDSNPRSSP